MLSKGFIKIRLVLETVFFRSLEFGVKGWMTDYTNVQSAQKTENQGIFPKLLLVIYSNIRGQQLARNDS